MVVGYNAYSPSGDVSGEVVYANYGLPEDYARARATGRRRARQDRARPLRPVVPRRQGAAGGEARRHRAAHLFRPGGRRLRARPGVSGRAVAAGRRHPARLDPVHLQLSGRSADARRALRCPGRAGSTRARAGNLPRIPTTPISYGDARPLLEGLGGPAAPESFRGGLPITYRVGPGRHAGAARSRHRLRAAARSATCSRRSAGDAKPRREGRHRRPLRRLDLRHQRQHQRLDDDHGDRAQPRPAARARLAARPHDRARRLGRRGVRPARLDRVGRAVQARSRARRRRLRESRRRRRHELRGGRACRRSTTR